MAAPEDAPMRPASYYAVMLATAVLILAALALVLYGAIGVLEMVL